jgi:hypothetical protein
MENKELQGVLRKSSNAAWTLGGFAIVYLIISLWIVNMVHNVL